MDLKLNGKRALITGSSLGIGASIAHKLAAEGAQVIVHGRDENRTASVAREITNSGGRAIPLTADISTSEGRERLISQATSAMGAVDILVNNAGEYAAKSWFDTTVENWDTFYKSDVLSAVGLMLLSGPAMKGLGWGRIINIATGLASTPQAIMPDYAAAKAALVNASLSASKALAGTGVTVNTISPGLIHTPNVEKTLREEARRSGWGEDWAKIQKQWFSEVLNNKSITRLGEPEEIADIVAFVASPRASYINGATFRVDGGLSPAIG